MEKQGNILRISNILPERLKEARMARGYSVVDLAGKIGVNRQSVYLYELGEVTPKSDVLEKIIDVLDLPLSYFTKEFEELDGQGTIFFRSQKTAEKIQRDSGKIKALWVERAIKDIEKFINFPKVNIPKFSNLIPFEPIDIDTIEDIANSLREYWSIGTGPINNVILLLEKNGFFVSTFEIPGNKTDGFSYWRKGRPYIYLSSDKNCAVRSRFSVCHELGHLILHNGINFEDLNDKKLSDRIEKEANIFASCFLMPKESFSCEIMSSSIDYFVPLKRRWKVSIGAMVYRCENLGIFSDNQITYLNKQISIRRWRKSEPLDDELSVETPSLLRQATSLVIKNKLRSASSIINELNIKAEELETILNLDKGILTNETPPVIELKVVKNNI